MFKKLRTQLMLASAITLIILLVAVWCFTRQHIIAAAVLVVLACVFVIALNIWFSHYVSEPISRLTLFSSTIASGTYGAQIEMETDSEVGELSTEINNLSEKVAVAEKTRTEFISQVSHELRTPLTAIMGWAETISFDEAVQGDSLRGINIISKEAERLTGMVAELLEFTRIQDGRFNLRLELIDIAAELEDAVFTYGELMRQADIELNYNAPDTDIPLIPGDSERLKQVFTNLFDNAMKHGGDGKKIDVVLKLTGNFVSISVRDYGHGIPEAELPHVKEKFYKGSSRNRGTGIGLAVCDEIITRHGGTLTIANADGGGCKVTLTLPLQNGENYA